MILWVLIEISSKGLFGFCFLKTQITPIYLYMKNVLRKKKLKMKPQVLSSFRVLWVWIEISNKGPLLGSCFWKLFSKRVFETVFFENYSSSLNVVFSLASMFF